MNSVELSTQAQVLTPERQNSPYSATNQSHQPGYLGPTSYEAILSLDNHAIPDRTPSDSGISDSACDHECFVGQFIPKSSRSKIALDALTCLRFFPVIDRLVVAFYGKAQALISPAPSPFILNALAAVRRTVEEFGLENNPPDPHLITAVLANTIKKVKVPPTASQFHEMFTGENLRLETIALLLNITARAVYIGLANEMTDGFQTANEMFRASSACVELCKLLAPVNDLLLWLYFDNAVLTSIICGDTMITSVHGQTSIVIYPLLWRRFGDLIGEIYALGIHRESKDGSMPIFLRESRRRIYCATYYMDKISSTLLGRPPRLCWRHTDIQLPLDLRDEDLVAPTGEVELACRSLDSNGWNTYGGVHQSTWIRLRCLICTFREQIMDHSIGSIDEAAEASLLNISRRGHEMWNSIPEHLRYEHSSWDDELVPSGVCFKLVLAHLAYLFNEFLIQKLLDKRPLAQNQAYLSVSMELLATVLTLGQPRDRVFDNFKDFSYIVLSFGIPSGSVLVTALQEQSATGASLPASITRSEIIRSISVLISNLESVSRPGDGNYPICKKAAKTFTRLIDDILDPKPSAAFHSTLDLGFMGNPSLDGLDNMDMADFFDNIEWGAGGQWGL
ncbi:hypothetical protein BU16DRAFT_597224 [Lophium mytilinum]|uniref:Xylanolytic transcriptional activator regulatory domain-containing protein n=1 Tax=Lophium mytilinum TaxID=390894 RepID=A0A6A6QCJ5_9PEZI|nr:hypothetical protein BU16DRAFT_597224 [Lophium mytilinum]